MKITLTLHYKQHPKEIAGILNEMSRELYEISDFDLRENLPYHQDVLALDSGQMIGHWVVEER